MLLGSKGNVVSLLHCGNEIDTNLPHHQSAMNCSATNSNLHNIDPSSDPSQIRLNHIATGIGFSDRLLELDALLPRFLLEVDLGEGVAYAHI